MENYGENYGIFQAQQQEVEQQTIGQKRMEQWE